MTSLIRRCPKNVYYTELFVVGSQMPRLTNPRYTSNSRYIQSRDISTKPTKRLVDLHTTFRKLTTQENKNQDFKAVFPDILNDLREIIRGYKQNETSEWLTTTLEYNLRNSENNIFLLTVLTYENLVNAKCLNSENLRLAHILGWCTEILNTAILMFDDIIDNDSTRRGQPCWHTLDNVGLTASNDAFMVENAVYALLKKNFRHLDCYSTLIELFHEASFVTGCGQRLDKICAARPISTFNMETYKTMAVHKGAHDNFYLPFLVAAELAGFSNEEALRQSKAIINEIGLFFQIQNDFLNCFGNLNTACKEAGTDIQDHKYSWLAVTCMERATEEQKQIMIECYGKKDPTLVERVKELYKDLDLAAVYAAYAEESYNRTKALIKQTSNGVLHEIFLQILNRVHRRET